MQPDTVEEESSSESRTTTVTRGKKSATERPSPKVSNDREAGK